MKQYTKKNSLNQFSNENKTYNNKKEMRNRRAYRKQVDFFGKKASGKNFWLKKNGE